MDYFVHDTAYVDHCNLMPGAKVYRDCDVRNSVLESGVSVGDFSRINDCKFAEGVLLQRNAMVYGTEIGKHSYTGKNFTAWHCKIGAFCSISWNVSLGGADHDYLRTTTHSFLYAPEFGFVSENPAYDRFQKPCIIGNNVWIAANVCICRGVKIGNGAVIGAGAVVTKDVEPYSIVGGVPAAPIKKRFDQNVIDLLQESRWWDFPDSVIKDNFELFDAKTDKAVASELVRIRRQFDEEMKKMTVSVAIPCYRSAKTIEQVVNDIRKAIMSRPGNDYQIILVNDYPADDTFSVIRSLCEKDSKIIGVNLTKNYGQTAAKMAAIPYLNGDVLVTMDDDGQHPAEDIYRLVDKVVEGYDIVYAHFKKKKHSFFKRITSKINSKILEINGSKPKGIYLSSYCAYSRTAAEALLKYKSPFPSIDGYLGQVADRVVNVEVEHRERLAGHSNYTLKRLLKLWLTGFTNFSVVPLRFAAFSGFFFALIGFLFGLFTVIRKLVTPTIAAGYTSIIALMLIIGGIIMMLLGLIGEYIGRIYMTVSNMAQYTVRETINAERRNGDDR